MRYLISGATGFLGREVLVRLLRQGAEVIAVVRRRSEEDEAQSKERLLAAVRKVDEEVSTGALRMVSGDVAEPGLGLSEAARRSILSGADEVHVLHGSAQVRFDQPYRIIQAQNVGGAANMLVLAEELAEAGRLHRFDFVSTAFVAGDRTDLVLETELEVGQTPRNTYERSKLEAEGLVEAKKATGLPVAIYRPSIIVGNSQTGRTHAFQAIYWPMKLYARGRWRTMLGRPETTVDVVPVDFVADAIARLVKSDEALAKTFHLVAGPEGQAQAKSLIDMAEEIFEGGRVRYVDPDLYERWLRPFVQPLTRVFRPDVARQGAVFLPYLKSNPTFSNEVATRILAPLGIAPPKVTDYFKKIMRYARDTSFGEAT